jgi:hypothetical protein
MKTTFSETEMLDWIAENIDCVGTLREGSHRAQVEIIWWYPGDTQEKGISNGVGKDIKIAFRRAITTAMRKYQRLSKK